MDLRMYILVNEDIKIGKGKLAGQVGHAVSSFIYHSLKHSVSETMELMDTYMIEQKKIILKCPQSVLETLTKEKGYYPIRDKGYTQLQPDTLTCVNIGIYDKNDVPEWVSKLKLYDKN